MDDYDSCHFHIGVMASSHIHQRFLKICENFPQLQRKFFFFFNRMILLQ